MTKFEKWVDAQGGPRGVAKLLDTGESTVYHWLNKRATPKVVMIRKILAAAKGQLTFEDILSSTKGK